ncbi:hypothetical protein EVAR_35668_1 [Eumeta japonica]|uniref:Zinc finger MYM-type protein 1 n=1 Tax=Eumeta variegata TaxID=151549 RepID=A0A4C1VHK9_EUMVA|nr:hypothetical protein EVAR_35668_1 [Eumeta japonica]
MRELFQKLPDRFLCSFDSLYHPKATDFHMGIHNLQRRSSTVPCELVDFGCSKLDSSSIFHQLGPHNFAIVREIALVHVAVATDSAPASADGGRRERPSRSEEREQIRHKPHSVTSELRYLTQYVENARPLLIRQQTVELYLQIDFKTLAIEREPRAEGLKAEILNTIKEYGIDLTKCRGQGYDGDVMSSVYGGLQTLIKEHAPNADYVHACNKFSFNDAAKNREVKNSMRANLTTCARSLHVMKPGCTMSKFLLNPKKNKVWVSDDEPADVCEKVPIRKEKNGRCIVYQEQYWLQLCSMKEKTVTAAWTTRADLHRIMSIKVARKKRYVLAFEISSKDKQALQDYCLFIAVIYVKSWLGCSLAVKTPYQDLCFLKRLMEDETVDKLISKAALSGFSQHLWYLSEEITVSSPFDDEVNEQTNENIAVNLHRDSLDDSGKKYIPLEDTSDYCYGK